MLRQKFLVFIHHNFYLDCNKLNVKIKTISLRMQYTGKQEKLEDENYFSSI